MEFEWTEYRPDINPLEVIFFDSSDNSKAWGGITGGEMFVGAWPLDEWNLPGSIRQVGVSSAFSTL